MTGVGDEDRQFFEWIVLGRLGRAIPWYFGLQLEGDALFRQSYADFSRIGRSADVSVFYDLLGSLTGWQISI